MDTLETTPRDHNQPPLTELLVEETAALKARADELIGAAGRAIVKDEETAGRAALLAKMMIEHGKKIETAREERKKPFLDSGRTVDAHFILLRTPLCGADPKKLGGEVARVVGLVDTFRRDQERKAAEERHRLEEEARKASEAAEAAARAQREAEERERRTAEESARKIREAEEAGRRSGNREAAEKAARERAERDAAQQREEAAATQRRLDAEMEQRRQTERAAELQRQADATKAATIDSGYGVKAVGRKVYKAEITDLTAAIRHCRKVDEASIKEAVQKIYDRQVRAGVRELPGATVTEDSATSIR